MDQNVSPARRLLTLPTENIQQSVSGFRATSVRLILLFVLMDSHPIRTR
ncbi:hypothetical protein WEI85_00370 [Actinomycetes bacterium KLBMP 9797]